MYDLYTHLAYLLWKAYRYSRYFCTASLDQYSAATSSLAPTVLRQISLDVTNDFSGMYIDTIISSLEYVQGCLNERCDDLSELREYAEDQMQVVFDEEAMYLRLSNQFVTQALGVVKTIKLTDCRSSTNHDTTAIVFRYIKVDPDILNVAIP